MASERASQGTGRAATVVVIAAAVLISAALAGLQLGLGRWSGVFQPAGTFGMAHDTWPFEMYLMTWYTATSVALGAGIAWAGFGARVKREPLSLVRGVVTGAVAGGALVALPVTRGWTAAAMYVDDPVGDATYSVLFGLLIGAGAGICCTFLPAARWGLLWWLGWTWLIAVTLALLGGRQPIGLFGLIDLPGAPELPTILAPPLALAALVAGLAAKRQERFPVLAAISGPLLLVATPLGVLFAKGSYPGSHYHTLMDLYIWLLLTPVAAAVAAGTVLVVNAKRRRERPSRPTGAGGARLLQIAGCLLIAAALSFPWWPMDVAMRLGVAAGAVCVLVGWRRARGTRPGPLVAVAVTGAAWGAAAALITWIEDSRFPRTWPPDLLVLEVLTVAGVGLLGWFGVRAAAACAAAAVGVVVARVGYLVQAGWLWQEEGALIWVSVVLGLLAVVALAGAVVAASRVTVTDPEPAA